jgi:hypothetical protein
MQQHLSIRDARRLKSCCGALQQLQAAKPWPCYFSAAEKTRIDMMDTLTMECLERERDALIRKSRYIAANDTSSWKIKEAADDFIFSTTAAERVGKRQVLEALMMGASFPMVSITNYTTSLAAMPLKVRPIDVIHGTVFVAELEGCDGFDRIVGHFDFDIDNEARLNHRYMYKGIETATAVYLRPVVSCEMEASAGSFKTSKEWAAYEKREQMYRHGINKVLNGGGGTSTFLSICMSKALCVRCGCNGHTSAVCRAVYKAAWAGGDLIA